MANIFETDQQIRDLTERLLDRTLPKQEWTHAAHCAAALCLERDHPGFDLSRDMPPTIRAYNTAVGTPNSDTEGYHETITQVYAQAVKQFSVRVGDEMPLAAALAVMLSSPFGDRAFPLRYYSKDLLFSVNARREFVAPDLREFDFDTIKIDA